MSSYCIRSHFQQITIFTIALGLVYYAKKEKETLAANLTIFLTKYLTHQQVEKQKVEEGENSSCQKAGPEVQRSLKETKSLSEMGSCQEDSIWRRKQCFTSGCSRRCNRGAISS